MASSKSSFRSKTGDSELPILHEKDSEIFKFFDDRLSRLFSDPKSFVDKEVEKIMK